MNNHKCKLWLKIVLPLLGIIIIAGATVFVLKQITPSKVLFQSAKEAVDAFSQQSPTYLANYKKADKPTNLTILYSGTDKRGYDIYLSTSQLAQYAKEDTSAKDNDGSAISKYEAFFKHHGLTQSSSNSNVTGYLTKIFENSTVACQTDEWQNYDKHGASYGFSCVDKTDIAKAYDDTDALLTKAKADITLSDIQVITATTISSTDKKQVKKLTTKQVDGSSLTLYYLNTEKGWNYIGMRPTPSVDVESSFIVPDKLKTAIQESPEKDFLTTTILGSNRQ